MHFLNRIGAIILFVCIAGASHAATLYVACGSAPASVFWVVYPILIAMGLYMWLRDWNTYFLFKFKWYDK
jgi:hypothetical protein